MCYVIETCRTQQNGGFISLSHIASWRFRCIVRICTELHVEDCELQHFSMMLLDNYCGNTILGS